MVNIMGATTTEKRLHKRTHFERPVSVWRQDCLTGSHCHPEPCKSHNISSGGMKLATSRALPAHSVVKLDFQMFHEKPVQVFAKVVWSTTDCCGLRFISPDESHLA